MTPVEPQYMCLAGSVSYVLKRYPGYSVSDQGQHVSVNMNVILISFKITGDKHSHILYVKLIYMLAKITN